MSAVVVRVELTLETIELTEYEALVAHEAAGAVVGFAGVVRDHDGGRSVTRLRVLGPSHCPADPRRGRR